MSVLICIRIIPLYGWFITSLVFDDIQAIGIYDWFIDDIITCKCQIVFMHSVSKVL